MRFLGGIVGLAVVLAGCLSPPEVEKPGAPSDAVPGQAGAPRELAFETFLPCDAKPTRGLETAINNELDFMDEVWRPICHPESYEDGGDRALWTNPPPIDFSTKTVFVAYLGPQPVNGWKARVQSIVANVGETVVRVAVQDPGTCAADLETTNPGEIVLAEKAAWGGSVRFEHEVHVSDCDGEAEGWFREAAWLFRATPDHLTGYMGETVTFTLEVKPSPGGIHGWLFQGTPWSSFGKEIVLSDQPLVLNLTAVIGPAPHAGFTLQIPDLLHKVIPVPSVTVRSRPGATPMGAPLEGTISGTLSPAPLGLSAVATPERAVVTYNLGIQEPRTCGEKFRSHGPFQVWNMSGRQTLVGFMTTQTFENVIGGCGASDQPVSSRLEVKAYGLEPGPLDIIVHNDHACCESPPWGTHRMTIQIPRFPPGTG